MTTTSHAQGWPHDWALRKQGLECALCTGPLSSWELVGRGQWADVHTDRRALPGYCVVVWTHGHVAEPTELPVEQATGYWQEVLAAGRAVELAFKPVKLNYLILGNAVPHLHAQIVPRFSDDPAAGRTIGLDQVFTSGSVGDDDAWTSDLERFRTILGTTLDEAGGNEARRTIPGR